MEKEEMKASALEKQINSEKPLKPETSKTILPESKTKNSEKKQLEYHKAEKFTLKKLKELIPPELIPTKETIEIAGLVFLIIIVISVMTLSFKGFSAVNEKSKMEVGIPWAFFSLSLSNPDAFPFKIGGFLLDFLLSLLIGYILNILINILKIRFEMFKKAVPPAELYNLEKEENTKKEKKIQEQKKPNKNPEKSEAERIEEIKTRINRIKQEIEKSKPYEDNKIQFSNNS